MHSIAPYTIRCFDGDLDSKRFKKKNSVLDQIRGKHDLFQILSSFVASHESEYTDFEDKKMVVRFQSTQFDEGARVVHGVLEVGMYGVRTNIINRETGAIDFKKTQQNAEIIPHYFCFYLPIGCDEGIALFASYRGIGIKTLFNEFFAKYFTMVTDRRLQMNPLSYDKAIQDWQEAQTKEIRAIRFTGFQDKADALSALGHEESDLILRPKKKTFFGKLKDFRTASTEQYKAIEQLVPLCAQVKAVVELDGRARVFRIGPASNITICQIELDEKVKLSGGMPQLDSMHDWVKELLGEFAKTVYPGKKVSL